MFLALLFIGILTAPLLTHSLKINDDITSMASSSPRPGISILQFFFNDIKASQTHNLIPTHTPDISINPNESHRDVEDVHMNEELLTMNTRDEKELNLQKRDMTDNEMNEELVHVNNRDGEEFVELSQQGVLESIIYVEGRDLQDTNQSEELVEVYVQIDVVNVIRVEEQSQGVVVDLTLNMFWNTQLK
jgi:hypothetical protein